MLDSAIGNVVAELDPKEARRAKALIHLLFTPAAWQHYKDFWDLDANEAGLASEWAATLLLNDIKSRKRNGHKS